MLADGGVTFTDIAPDAGSGLTYSRQRSPSDAAFDAIKQQPEYTFDDLLITPLKSRGAPGVAIFDYDDDGDLDLYVTNGPGKANSLFANQLMESGAVSFFDLALAAGVDATEQNSNGTCSGDLDNDGDTELLVLGNSEPNLLFENQGGGLFTDITAAAGLGGGILASTSCSMGDINGDGWLDIFVGNALDMSVQLGIFTEPFGFNQANQLFVNQGDGSFVEGAAAAGLLDLDLPAAAPPDAATITWAVALVDIDLDGDTDVVHADDQAAFPAGVLGGIDRGYVQIFENDGSGQFTNMTYERDMGRPGAWMGLSFGDFDSNGTMDLFGSNFGNHPGFFVGFSDTSVYHADSRWFLQQDEGSFLDPSDPVRLNTPFGWGTSALDYDNDGDSDILFHGGLDVGPFVATNPGSLLAGDGAGGFTRDLEALAGSTEHVRRTVHGVATGDLDGNGFQDIVTVANFTFYDAPLTMAPPLGGEFDLDAVVQLSFLPLAMPPDFLFTWSGIEFADGDLSVELNDGANGNHSLQVRTLGTVGLTTDGAVNRDGIGAVVRFRTPRGKRQMVPVLGGSSYASQHALASHFGLGSERRGLIDVLWPGGTRNRLYTLRLRERVTFPEIPCSYAEEGGFFAYLGCTDQALDELEAAGVIDAAQAFRFFASAVRAYFDHRR